MTAEMYLEGHREQSLDELKELLRIPSISSLPEHEGDVQRAAEWVANRLRAAGVEHVEVLPTGGHPVVYGDWLHAEGKPTVLIYGHFDVQPVDPVNLWARDPFDPTVKDGRVYARGASDMKGNLLMAILGFEAAIQERAALLPNVKFFLEGQEEIGSPQLPDFVASHKDLLAADLVLNADGGQAGENQPSLTLGLKGETGLQIDVYGANSDLHSGGYGGAVANPLHALVRILDSMRSPEGKIMVEGFYDDVVDLTEQDRQEFATVPFDEAGYFRKLDLTDGFGEPGYSTRERAWARPTLELNGMWGGFQGTGIKTVLPKEAHAKITCRLVKNQNPEKILATLIRHIENNTPSGVRVEIDPLPFFAQPYLMPKEHWGNTIVAAVLEDVYGKAPYFDRSGGTVPVVDVFLSNLGAYSVGLGFGLNDENVHAPNEFLRIASFERGQRVWTKVLQRMAMGAPEQARP